MLAVTLGLRRQLFAVCQDEEFARVTGLPVRLLNLLIAVTAAVTVTVAMRVVGLLLVSALMVVPVAAAQQVTRGFARDARDWPWPSAWRSTLTGTVTSFYVDVPPGATIVLLAIGRLRGLSPRSPRRCARRRGPRCTRRYPRRGATTEVAGDGQRRRRAAGRETRGSATLAQWRPHVHGS